MSALLRHTSGLGRVRLSYQQDRSAMLEVGCPLDYVRGRALSLSGPALASGVSAQMVVANQVNLS